MTAALVLLDIDPNLVRPGWTALVVVVLLALAMTGLFFSMRRQFRKLDANRAAAEDVEQEATLPEGEETQVASAPAAEVDAQPDDRPAPRPGPAPTS